MRVVGTRVHCACSTGIANELADVSIATDREAEELLALALVS